MGDVLSSKFEKIDSQLVSCKDLWNLGSKCNSIVLLDEFTAKDGSYAGNERRNIWIAMD